MADAPQGRKSGTSGRRVLNGVRCMHIERLQLSISTAIVLELPRSHRTGLHHWPKAICLIAPHFGYFSEVG